MVNGQVLTVFAKAFFITVAALSKAFAIHLQTFALRTLAGKTRHSLSLLLQNRKLILNFHRRPLSYGSLSEASGLSSAHGVW